MVVNFTTMYPTDSTRCAPAWYWTLVPQLELEVKLQVGGELGCFSTSQQLLPLLLFFSSSL